MLARRRMWWTITSHCASVYIVGGRTLWQRMQLLDQSSSPVSPMWESVGFVSSALGLASIGQLPHAERSKSKMETCRPVLLIVGSGVKIPWLPGEGVHSCWAHHLDHPIHKPLSLPCWD